MSRPRSESPIVTFWAERNRWLLTYYTNTGGQHRRTRESFDTEAEARKFAAQIDAHLAGGPIKRAPVPPPIARAAPSSALTVETFATEFWLPDVVEVRSPATRKSYLSNLKWHILPAVGSVRLRDLRVDHMTGMLRTLRKAGRTWGTQKTIVGVFGSLCSYAKHLGALSTNPCDGFLDWNQPSDKTDEVEPNPLTLAQADAFLTWVRTGAVPGQTTLEGPRGRSGRLIRVGYPEWYPYFLTLLRTGMRRGEAAALRWDTVHLDRTPPRAWLKKNFSPAAAKESKTGRDGEVPLKGKRSHEIDLAPVLVDVLRQVRHGQRHAALQAGRSPSPYVFLSLRGKRALPDGGVADRVFALGMAALGLESANHTIHDLRDTFATCHLTQDPGRLFWVSWMLGHRSTTTTLNRYTRWVPQLSGVSYAGALDGSGLRGGESGAADGDRE